MNKITLIVFLLLSVFPQGKTAEKALPELIYINDPLCSWCYGFAPEATKLREKYKTVAHFRLIEGGLRPGVTAPMDEKRKKNLQQHWEEIQEKTGQPFSYEILQSDFIYDTEPPCRAVVTMRKLKPEAEYEFLMAIQNSFYFRNKNTNDIATYLELLPEGISEQDFTDLFYSDEIKKETQNDFRLSDSLHITGFPALLLKKDNRYKVITHGYEKFEKLEKLLDKELFKKP